jgi:hypothetical protein
VILSNLSASDRRACLVALAVITLFLGACDTFACIPIVVLLASPPSSRPRPLQISGHALIITLINNLLCMVSLFIARMGYRARLRVCGRYVGSAYAVVWLFLSLVLGPPLHGISLLILAYPAITLVMVNRVLDKELVN